MDVLAKISIFFILLPTVFQYIYGNRNLNKETNVSFQNIVFISAVSHILLTILSIYLTNLSLTDINTKHACGMPTLGIIFISGVIFLIFLVIMISQSVRK